MANQKVKLIKLDTIDQECRCCGSGKVEFCDRCWDLFQKGYSIMIEVKNRSTAEKKRPTGYAIAVLPGLIEPVAELPLQTNQIYFIREADLKEFLGDEYNRHIRSTFLSTSPKWTNANRRTTASTRQAAELATG
jgi:hypothetical protein